MFDTTSIGTSFPPFTVEVERPKIQEFALAIEAKDPIYHSREAAQEAGYPDIALLPTLPIQFEFWGNPHWMERLETLGINTTRMLHAEQEYTYLASIQPGNTLSAVTTVLDGKTRKGLEMVTLETRYTNQDGETVLTAQMKLVIRA